jgi:hypothetical protein
LPLSVNPIARIPFDYNFNDIEGDIDGVSTGATLDSAQKQIGVRSVEFSGAEFVTIGNVATYKFAHGADNPTAFQLTASFWLRLNNPEPDALVGIYSTASLAGAKVGMDIYFDDTSGEAKSRRVGMRITRGVAGTAVVNALSPDNAYPNDTGWHSIIVTYDQSLANSNCNIYVDNSLVHTHDKTGLAPSTANATHVPHIGCLATETSFVDGNIDELLLFDQVITSDDREFLYNKYAAALKGNRRKNISSLLEG